MESALARKRPGRSSRIPRFTYLVVLACCCLLRGGARAASDNDKDTHADSVSRLDAKVREQLSPGTCTISLYPEGAIAAAAALVEKKPLHEGARGDFNRTYFPNDSAPRYRYGTSPVCTLERRVVCRDHSNKEEGGLRTQDGTSSKNGQQPANDDFPTRVTPGDAQLRHGDKRGKAKGRALVLYNMPFSGADDRPSEWDNFAHFLKFGVLKPKQASKLFDQVDYVFYRINPAVDDVTLFLEKGNLMFVWVPATPCDLCAHILVLEFLGLEEAAGYAPKGNGTAKPRLPIRAWRRDYRTVVFMNGGVRGPFLARREEAGQHELAATEAASTSWVDIVSMGAPGTTRPLYWEDEEMLQVKEEKDRTTTATDNNNDHRAAAFKTITGLLYGIKPKTHIQGYWFNIPMGLLREYVTLMINGCRTVTMGKDRKLECVYRVETETLVPFLEDPRLKKWDTQFYFTAVDMRISRKILMDWGPLNPKKRLKDAPGLASPGVSRFSGALYVAIAPESFRKKTKIGNSKNPNSYPTDPCAAVFIKFGGVIFNFMPDLTHLAVQHLTVGSQGGLAATLKAQRSIRRRDDRDGEVWSCAECRHGAKKTKKLPSPDQSRRRRVYGLADLRRDLAGWVAANEYSDPSIR